MYEIFKPTKYQDDILSPYKTEQQYELGVAGPLLTLHEPGAGQPRVVPAPPGPLLHPDGPRAHTLSEGGPLAPSCPQ